MAMLAITNVDSVFNEQAILSKVKYAKTQKQNYANSADRAAVNPSYESAIVKLKESLGLDELKGVSLFEDQSVLEPIAHLLEKGVSNFARQAFRSPTYKGEFGYDLLHYEIKHPDGCTSSLLAYLEQDVPTLLFIVGEQNKNELFYFRESKLIERSWISATEARSLIESKIQESLPFLSVSR